MQVFEIVFKKGDVERSLTCIGTTYGCLHPKPDEELIRYRELHCEEIDSIMASCTEKGRWLRQCAERYA